MERQESCVENAVFFEFPILTGYFKLNDDQSPMGTEVGRAQLLGLLSISAGFHLFRRASIDFG